MVNIETFAELHRPAYILEEKRLRSNLSLIRDVARKADIEIILAFKAYALWKTFHIFKEYINSTTASSLYEATLAYKEFGAPAHTFSPAYTDYEIEDIAKMSSHLTFNSLTQYERHHRKALLANPDLKLGIRVNPEYSEVGTDLYNPCAPGTRFGVLADDLPEQLPADITGFHCHCHCESGSDVFERTLKHIEEKFAKWFTQIKWINFGGGHLMTRKDYDIEKLIKLMQDFHARYPHLHIILEPGSAFGWQTGPLVAQVVDIVENKGIRTAIVNVSFTCHMPDCLEMPYMPEIRFASQINEFLPCKPAELERPKEPINELTKEQINELAGATETIEQTNSPCPEPGLSTLSLASSKKGLGRGALYRIGGCSCLSGDFMGMWRFDHELQVGENIIFEDMLHYTTVKTTMFNGISHPSIMLLKENGELVTLREYRYEDYRDRMD